MEWQSFLGAGTLVVTSIFAAEWIFIAWLSRQFSKVYLKMDELTEKILAKLEYHERHDDKRFSDIQDSLTDLRIKDASRDSIIKWLDRKPPNYHLSEKNAAS